MSLIETIRTKQLQARVSNQVVAKNLLTALIGEAEIVGKNKGNRLSTDDEVMTVINAFLKNAKDNLKLLADKPDRLKVVEEEISILKEFLPTQLTHDALSEIIHNQIDIFTDKNPKQIGKILSYLKTNYTNQYDPQLASNIAKNLLI